MSRQKKSRKAAPLGPTQKPRQKKDAKPDDKRVRKHKGLTSGNRNNPETVTPQGSQPTKSNDPRHGSKKPISLTGPDKTQQPQKSVDFEPQIKLVKVKEPELTLEEELALIENDQRLLDLLDRADADEVLKGKDAKYFNAKTARHQAIIEELGIDDDADLEDDEDWQDDEELDVQQGKSLIEQWENDDGPEEN